MYTESAGPAVGVCLRESVQADRNRQQHSSAGPDGYRGPASAGSETFGGGRTILRDSDSGALAPDGDARADTELAGSTCERDRADLGASASLEANVSFESVGDKLEASASVERDVDESVRPDANRLATSLGDLSSPQLELATVAGVPTSDGSAGPRHVRPSDAIGSGHFEPGTGKVYDRVPHGRGDASRATCCSCRPLRSSHSSRRRCLCWQGIGAA